MTDYNARIEKLQAHLGHVDVRLAEYEAMVKRAKGPISPSFQVRLNDLKEERDRLVKHIRQLEEQQATRWSSDDPRIGVLKICDEIAARINELFDRLEHHRPPH